MMLLPWHRRGVRFAQRSHAIRVQARRPMGSGAIPPLLGSRAVRGFGLRSVAWSGCVKRLSSSKHTGDQWEMNNCRLQIAMALYRLGDLRRRRGDESGREEGRTRDRRRPGPRDRAGGLGQGHRRPGPGGPDPHRASNDRARTSSRWRASCRQKAFASWVQATPAAAIAAFDESQRLFRRAGMKNAGVSPVRPWLLTALRRAAEATPEADRRARAALLRRARSSPGRPGAERASTATTCRMSCASARYLAALAGHRRRARSLFDRSLEVANAQGAQSRGAADQDRSRRARPGDGTGRGAGRRRTGSQQRSRHSSKRPWKGSTTTRNRVIPQPLLGETGASDPFTGSSRADSSDPSV